MEVLHWELSVLSRAVVYNNLSEASFHVGLSQPQLSRIVGRLEAHFDVHLLDRESKRKSGWTAMAFRMAEAYSKGVRNLGSDLQRVLEQSEPHVLRVGTLEGLGELAAHFSDQLFQATKTQTIELEVQDLNELEEKFLKNGLDMIFTSREPSRKKFKYARLIGYQNIQTFERSASPLVLSPFEFSSRQSSKKKTSAPERLLISNSLVIRKYWLEKFGGKGDLPSLVKTEKVLKGRDSGVYLFGGDHLSRDLWKKITHIPV